jgi:hypothetical protein
MRYKQNGKKYLSSLVVVIQMERYDCCKNKNNSDLNNVCLCLCAIVAELFCITLAQPFNVPLIEEEKYDDDDFHEFISRS